MFKTASVYSLVPRICSNRSAVPRRHKYRYIESATRGADIIIPRFAFPDARETVPFRFNLELKIPSRVPRVLNRRRSPARFSRVRCKSNLNRPLVPNGVHQGAFLLFISAKRRYRPYRVAPRSHAFAVNISRATFSRLRRVSISIWSSRESPFGESVRLP